MTTNLYFSQSVRSEQGLYEDIIIEALKMYGQDVYYIPRDIVGENTIFGDDVPSRFNSSHKIEMYIENVEGFDGEGDLFTKFGVEIRDQATFVVARKRWTQAVKKYDSEITSVRPLEGDLIYLPLSKSMFQIMHVEHEQPFYQLSNLPTYKLRCELFEYNDEDFDTDVTAIDDIQREYGYRFVLNFTQTRAQVTAQLTSNDSVSTTIANAGKNYSTAPDLQISNLPLISDIVKFGTSSLNPSTFSPQNTLTEKTGDYSAFSYRGIIEFFVYIEELPEIGNRYRLFSTGSTTSDEGKNYRRTFGVDSEGRINFMNHESGEILIFAENIPEANRLTENTWHHIRISYRGEESGESVRTAQFYIDGEVVFRFNSDFFGAIFDDYAIGGTNIVNSKEFMLLNGYIDDFVAVDEQPDYTDTITVPTTAQSARVNRVAYESFDVSDLTGTTTINDEGEISAVALTNNHNYFRVSPTIVVREPVVPVYTVGERVTQTLDSGVVISGEVVKWDNVNLVLWLTNLGSSDGKYHEMITTKKVIDPVSGDSVAPDSITEENTISENEQNDSFESFADNIIDFTESNPFGDPDES